MTNKFITPNKGKYDLIDKTGKGWILKKGESMEELKKRAEGKKNDK